MLGEDYLRAGDHVGLRPDGTYGRNAAKLVGIIDSFISPLTVLNKGDRVWLMIYPRKINSLRHVWSHPDFEDVADLPIRVDPEVIRDLLESPVSLGITPSVTRGVLDPEAQKRTESRKWIERYANSFGTDYHGGSVTYDELIDGARAYVLYGEYLTLGGLFEGESTSEEFWYHWEVATGEKAGADYGENFFSCSC